MTAHRIETLDRAARFHELAPPPQVEPAGGWAEAKRELEAPAPADVGADELDLTAILEALVGMLSNDPPPTTAEAGGRLTDQERAALKLWEPTVRARLGAVVESAQVMGPAVWSWLVGTILGARIGVRVRERRRAAGARRLAAPRAGPIAAWERARAEHAETWGARSEEIPRGTPLEDTGRFPPRFRSAAPPG